MIRTVLMFLISKCQIEDVQRWDCDRRRGIMVWHTNISYTEFAGQSFGGTFVREQVCAFTETP